MIVAAAMMSPMDHALSWSIHSVVKGEPRGRKAEKQPGYSEPANDCAYAPDNVCKACHPHTEILPARADGGCRLA